MMSLPERAFGVWLDATFVGTLRQKGNHTTLELHESYTENPRRPVLGQVFEQDLNKVHASALRLPAWFSNLLPEGVQRGWLARQRGVSDQREMELLAEVGRDLPGAVTVLSLPAEVVSARHGGAQGTPRAAPDAQQDGSEDGREKFSLAGVQLKLSMITVGDRLVLPLGGQLGDWIVKFPDAALPHLPVVEHATMELARRSGIDVPTIQLLDRDELPDTPDAVWGSLEVCAFAIERFDRTPERGLIHIEDFAQVRGFYADQKYAGSYETLAALVHRGEDDESLRELVRRLALNVLVNNADAHLKNFSLRYVDPRRPELSPAYDVVSTSPYPGFDEQMALRLAGTKDGGRARLRNLDALGTRAGLPAGELADVAETTVAAAVTAWPDVAEEHLADHPRERAAITAVIEARAVTLRAR